MTNLHEHAYQRAIERRDNAEAATAHEHLREVAECSWAQSNEDVRALIGECADAHVDPAFESRFEHALLHLLVSERQPEPEYPQPHQGSRRRFRDHGFNTPEEAAEIRERDEVEGHHLTHRTIELLAELHIVCARKEVGTAIMYGDHVLEPEHAAVVCAVEHGPAEAERMIEAVVTQMRLIPDEDA